MPASLRLNDGDRLPVAVHFATLLGVFGLTLAIAAAWPQWFVQDEWDWILRFLPGEGIDLLRSHNGHLVAMPLVVFRVIYSVVGLESYWPYLVPAVAMHVVAGHMIWRVMRRCGADPWIATGLVAAYLVSAPAAFNAFLALQIGWSTPIALGLGAILLLDRPEADPTAVRRDLAAAALLLLALSFNGLAVAFVAGSGILAFIRRGRAGFWRPLAPVVAAYGTWWLAAGRDGPRPDSLVGVLKVPAFAWTVLTSAFDASTLAGPGAVLALALGWWLVTRRREAISAAAPAFALAGAAMVFLLLLGLARGGQPPDTQRYSAVAWALVLPAVTLGLGDLVVGPRARRLAGVGLGLLLGINGLAGYVEHAQRDEVRETALRRRVLAAAAVVAREPYFADIKVDEMSATPLTAEVLAALVKEDRLPKSVVTSRARLDAALALQVRWASSPGSAVDPRTGPVGEPIGQGSDRSTTTGDPGCIRLDAGGTDGYARLSLRSQERSSLRVSSAGHAEVSLSYSEGSGGDVPASNAVIHHLDPGTEEFIDLAGGRSTLVLTPTAGTPVVVCGMNLPGTPPGR